METIKMITIDLDGTLLRSDGSVSDHTVETLQKARQKGVIVAIATGRMYQTAKAYENVWLWVTVRCCSLPAV